MRKLLLCAAAAAMLVAAGPAEAAKKKKKTKTAVTVNATLLAAAVSVANGVTTLAGTVTDPKLGAGAAVYTTTGTSTQQVTFTSWTDAGSIKGTGQVTLGTATPAQIPFTGTGVISGGAGKYKGAKGTLTFTGFIQPAAASPTGAPVAHISATGSFTY